MLPKPSELRELSRAYRQVSAKETSPQVKRTLAIHALMLAQLAEQIERGATDEFAITSNLERYQRMLVEALDEKQRKMVEMLLNEEQAKPRRVRLTAGESD